MKAFQLLAFLLPIAFADEIPTDDEPLPPGGVVDFARVNKCVMGVFGWDYNGYGCYCGFGGSGIPIDGIDECCKIHDECYGKANKDVCYKFQLYVLPYSFTCKDHVATCDSSNSECQMALCECDVAVTACWKKFPVPSKKLKCIKQKVANTEEL